jgi:hypothetical protein
MRLTRGLRGGGSLSLLSCSCSSTTGLRSQPRLMAAPKVSAFSHLLYHLLTKLGASSPLGGLELRQSQGRRISRDVVVRWDTRGKKANDKARRRAVRSQKDDAPQETRHHACPAILMAGDTLFLSSQHQLIALAARHRIPALFEQRESVLAGGLMSYGPSAKNAYRSAGIYVSRLLKGAKPSELPIQLPTKYDLVINLKTAKALGLNVPNSIQLLADEVIE